MRSANMNGILLPTIRTILRTKSLKPVPSVPVRRFKDFGHRKDLPQPRLNFYIYSVIIMTIVTFFNYDIIWDPVKAEAEDTNDGDKKKPKVTKPLSDGSHFRERTIIQYENRIREYSNPEKIFRYFATVKIYYGDNSEAYMTPDDFLRAIMPGLKQPDASKRHFRIAFKMFDLNGDGNVDVEEFEKVTTLIRQQNSMGSRYRDIRSATNFGGINSSLIAYFFGKNRKKKLSIDEFLKFQEQLQFEILSLEFELKNPNENGLITENDFAELLLAYSGFRNNKRMKILKRVRRKYRDHSFGISKKDYLDFFRFLSNINDVHTALTFYHISGADIDPFTMKHVAKTVSQVDLRDHVIDVVFTLFDENRDGRLSNQEFVMIMKRRLLRGLEKPKDIGFFKVIYSYMRCAKAYIISDYFRDK